MRHSLESEDIGTLPGKRRRDDAVVIVTLADPLLPEPVEARIPQHPSHDEALSRSAEPRHGHGSPSTQSVPGQPPENRQDLVVVLVVDLGRPEAPAQLRIVFVVGRQGLGSPFSTFLVWEEISKTKV